MYLKIILAGRLGRDPEMRYTQGGQPVTTLSVATNRRWTDRVSDEPREETTWFRVSVWGKQGEACNEYLTKGSQVLVEAERIQASPYLIKEGDKKGEAAASLEVTARTVHFIGGRGAQTGGDALQEPPEDVDEITF